MGEIKIEFMGRHVGTFGHEAHVAKCAGIHHRTKVIAGDAVQLATVTVINQVKEARKTIAEIEAAPATVTDIKHSTKFFVQLVAIVKVRVLPIYRMARWGIQAAFSAHAGLSLFNVRMCPLGNTSGAAKETGQTVFHRVFEPQKSATFIENAR
jgi:hypothetical protein